MTATFGSNCWRTVKHFANPERLLHFHQPCFENRLKSPPQPPPPTISLKKKNFMKDFCLYSGPCKMVTAAGYGGHNYLSTQRKIQMSKDSGHLACRGPGQAAVTHQACQAAPLPLQAGSILTHSFARWMSGTEASDIGGGSISGSLNPNMTQVVFKTFFS